MFLSVSVIYLPSHNLPPSKPELFFFLYILHNLLCFTKIEYKFPRSNNLWVFTLFCEISVCMWKKPFFKLACLFFQFNFYSPNSETKGTKEKLFPPLQFWWLRLDGHTILSGVCSCLRTSDNAGREKYSCQVSLSDYCKGSDWMRAVSASSCLNLE